MTNTNSKTEKPEGYILSTYQNAYHDKCEELEKLKNENYNSTIKFAKLQEDLGKYKSLGYLSRGLISVDGVTIEHVNGRGVIIKNRFNRFELTDSDLLMLANFAGLFKGDK